MDDEQLYYKEKYFKYKLKYLTLKEQLGGVKESNSIVKAINDRISSFIKRQTKEEKISFNSADDNLNKYIQNYDNRLYKTISHHDVLKKIEEELKNNPSKYKNIDDTIDVVLKKELKILNKYLKDSIKSSYKSHNEFFKDSKEIQKLYEIPYWSRGSEQLWFESDTRIMEDVQTYDYTLYYAIMNNDILKKIEDELKNNQLKYYSIDNVIDVVLKKELKILQDYLKNSIKSYYESLKNKASTPSFITNSDPDPDPDPDSDPDSDSDSDSKDS
jgi:hypothetical protein